MFWTSLLGILMVLTAIFLSLLVLIQRGRGGGLAGAFGGMGGQSAFGTKAGDMFTRVTIGVAAFWIVLCLVSLKLMGGASTNPFASNLGGSAPGGSGVPSSDQGGPGPAIPTGGAPAASGTETGKGGTNGGGPTMPGPSGASEPSNSGAQPPAGATAAPPTGGAPAGGAATPPASDAGKSAK